MRISFPFIASLLILLAALAVCPAPLHAQEDGDAATPALARAATAERLESQRAHLWRSIVWGGVNTIGGGALWALADRANEPARWAFAVETTLWGAINVGIATAGLLLIRGEKAAESWSEAVRSERVYHDVLLFNMGLDVAYISAGTVMVIASYCDIGNAGEWRGHGVGIIVQGLGLLALEGYSIASSRRRLGGLLSLRPSVLRAPELGAWGLALSGRW